VDSVAHDWRYEYRDENDDTIAGTDDLDARDTMLHTLIQDGHPHLRAWVDGRRAMGSYGDYG